MAPTPEIATILKVPYDAKNHFHNVFYEYNVK